MSAVRADWSTSPSVYDDDDTTWPKVEFVDAPEFGMKAARFESASLVPDTRRAIDNLQIMNWHKYLNANTKQMWTGSALGSVPMNDLYLRYCVMLESSVWIGINETGVKLGGFDSINGGNGPGIKVATPFWHERPDTQGRIRLTTYWFGEEIKTGTWGGDWIQGKYLEQNKWHCLEQHLKLNTMNPDGSANPDAIIEAWLDDQPIFRKANFVIHRYTGPNPIEINTVHGQIYHGGRNMPITPIHYRVTGFALAKRRIGSPQRLIP